MAKSKRAQVGKRFSVSGHPPHPPPRLVSLTKTGKKGKEQKSRLIEQIRELAATHSHLYVFRVKNMRNIIFKQVRDDMSDLGRFFVGKNKVMAFALGTEKSSEVLPGASCIARLLVGDVGLFLGNEKATPRVVSERLNSYQAQDYARTGSVAQFTVVIEADEKGLRNLETGELLPATVEPQLRQSGMPTSLRGGMVLLAAPQYTVCEAGQVLTVDQARILKQFGIQMAEFQIEILAYLSEGELQETVQAGGESEEEH